MILLVTGSSTDPAIFHAGCRPIQHVGLRPTLTFDHVGTNPIIISERKLPALTYDHVVTYPTILSERPNTYIWSTNERRKAQHLHLGMQGTNPPCQKAPTFISDQPMIEERHNTYIWSTHDQRKALHLHLTHTRNQSICMFEKVCTHI